MTLAYSAPFGGPGLYDWASSSLLEIPVLFRDACVSYSRGSAALGVEDLECNIEDARGNTVQKASSSLLEIPVLFECERVQVLSARTSFPFWEVLRIKCSSWSCSSTKPYCQCIRKCRRI